MNPVGLLLIDGGATGYSYPKPDEEADVGTADTNRVVMQFTGLLDKNRKEIYEGDLLRGSAGSGDQIDEVMWSDREARWILHNAETSDGEAHFFAAVCEVIGNIYENPELLNPTEV
jgi:hypothetical protein